MSRVLLRALQGRPGQQWSCKAAAAAPPRYCHGQRSLAGPARFASAARLRSISSSTATARASAMSSQANPWDEELPKDAQLFLVQVPDLPNSKRSEVRQDHLKDAKIAHERGWIVQGGPLYTDKQDPTKMCGSWGLFRARDEDDLRQRLSKDVYTKGGAWDMSKVSSHFDLIAPPHCLAYKRTRALGSDMMLRMLTSLMEK